MPLLVAFRAAEVGCGIAPLESTSADVRRPTHHGFSGRLSPTARATVGVVDGHPPEGSCRRELDALVKGHGSWCSRTKRWRASTAGDAQLVGVVPAGATFDFANA